jgi:hypothetical protein
MEAILVHMDMELMTMVILTKGIHMDMIINTVAALIITTLIIKRKILTKIIHIITIIKRNKISFLI